METILERKVTPSKTFDKWKVIVLNDNHNTFDYVAYALSKCLPHTDYSKGLEHANTIHNQGCAVVFQGYKEIAELYWFQLKELGLTMAELET